MRQITVPDTYEVLEQREIADVASTGYRLRHKKTGARIVLLANEDDNKVFYIGFRTPPGDSTGVAHILEHSTLCGSKAFPVKDPFVELVKGSLNTFLNAMTYPDKTVYPVASCNDRDFQNLIHVYLDAVFRPNVYENESIFRQEGWHYEFDEDGKLSVNGVVYNEMKGAFSAPDEILSRKVMDSLYPDTCYGVESGGDPECIPDLTYEQFLEFHRAYYHPSNSYIYLYGDMDFAEKLNFLDSEYLSKYDALRVDSEIPLQKTFEHPVRADVKCPLGEGEDADENTFLSENWTLADSLDRKLYLAFDVMDYALCSSSGAPLKKALTERGIGKEIYSTYQNGIRQPYYSIVAKGAEPSREKEFHDTIREVLEGIVRDGFDKRSLLAGINHFEFQYREADFGSYPKGLMLGLQALDSWLYEDTAPFHHIEALDTFRFLKEAARTDYFEQLVQKYLLDNPHRSIVTVRPEAGVEEAREEKLRKRLDAVREGLSEKELEGVRETFRTLRAFQEREDSREDLEKLPQLARKDLKKEALPLTNELRTIGETEVLLHRIQTTGIGYLRLVFRIGDLPFEELPYAAMLAGILGEVDTDEHTYAEINNELNLVTGGFDLAPGVYGNVTEPSKYQVTFEVKTKYLYEHGAEAMKLIREILLTSHLGDTVRLREILEEGRSQIQGNLLSAGHQAASGRAAASLFEEARVSEELSGLEFYRFLSDLLEHFDERKEALTRRLRGTLRKILRPENLFVDFTGEDEGIDALPEMLSGLRGALFSAEEERAGAPDPGAGQSGAEETGTAKPGSAESRGSRPALLEAGEGLMSAGQVQYVCRAGSFRDKGLAYTGALRVLRVFLGYQYLWMNVRVKGGAYGCFSRFGRSGLGLFVSYRDPNLARTIEVYEGAPEAIEAFDADERGMAQLIIGAVSELDQPLNPAAKGSRSFHAYMTGLTDEMIRQERAEVLGAQPEDLRKLAEYVRAILSDERLVVVGNAAQIQAEKERFRVTENLL